MGIGLSAGRTTITQTTREPIEDLRFIAELVIKSGRRLVIEDFHYLSHEERRSFAFDLKALWDFGLFVVIVGVWSESNLFMNLNHDLTGRVREESIVWSEADLLEILDKGGKALNIRFDALVSHQLVDDSYGNSGILQRLTLDALDRAGIEEKKDKLQVMNDPKHAVDAALFYAEELNTAYQTFAQKVAGGIRTYSNSTGIYGHAMAVVFDGTDAELLSGIHIDTIYRISHDRQSRIQKGNLRSVLEKFESLQVDEDGRGLVLSYADEKVRVIDRQLLLYRRYSTVRWPWEDLIAQADQRESGYEADGGEKGE